jgi:hypothetical protein
MSAGQSSNFAQEVHQQQARLNFGAMLRAVDIYSYVFGHRGPRNEAKLKRLRKHLFSPAATQELR